MSKCSLVLGKPSIRRKEGEPAKPGLSWSEWAGRGEGPSEEPLLTPVVWLLLSSCTELQWELHTS